MKRTNKQNQRSYYGGLGNSEYSKPKKESAVRKSTKKRILIYISKEKEYITAIILT